MAQNTAFVWHSVLDVQDAFPKPPSVGPPPHLLWKAAPTSEMARKSLVPWQGWIRQLLETVGIGFHLSVCLMEICDFATYRVSCFEFLILSLNDDILEHSCEEQLALGSDEKHKENLVASDPEITLHLLQRGIRKLRSSNLLLLRPSAGGTAVSCYSTCFASNRNQPKDFHYVYAH